MTAGLFLYSVTFDNISVSAAGDILHGTVLADNPVILMGLRIGQVGIADLGDAQEEMLRLGLYRSVTGGSGGTAGVETQYSNSSVPAADTVMLIQPTTSTVGTLMEVIPWNVRMPLEWFPIPELRPRIDSTEDPFAFRLIAAPADPITFSGTLWWREG